MKTVIEVYSDMAKSIPPWSAAEEREFVKSCSTRTGKWRSKAAKDKFVNEAMKRNLNLMFKLVNKYSFKKPTEDVIQLAVVAMVEALKKYDPGSGNKLSTWIHQPIVWSVKRLQHAYSKSGGVADEISALNHRYGMNLSVMSLDAEVGNSDDGTDAIGNLISERSVNTSYLLDRKVKTEDESMYEREVVAAVRSGIVELKGVLNEREQYVIRGFLKGQTMQEISVELKLSRMRVSQISANAFDKIRNSKVGRKLKVMLKD